MLTAKLLLMDTDEMAWTIDAMFHSDIMLTEKAYKRGWLQSITTPNSLFAVNVKGLTQEEHLKNTRKAFLEYRFWDNLSLIQETGLNFYFTFTNVSLDNQENFWTRCDQFFGKEFYVTNDGNLASPELGGLFVKPIEALTFGRWLVEQFG